MSLWGFVLVFVLACIFTPIGRRSGKLTFLDPGNLSDILRQVSEKGILAVGMTFVIIAGGIDLGVGSVLALCATMTAVLAVYGQWGAAETVLIVLAMGGVLGLFNGAVISKGRIQPFVVTLAMMLAARGLARIVSGGAGVGTPFPAPDEAGGYLHGMITRDSLLLVGGWVLGLLAGGLVLTALLAGISRLGDRLHGELAGVEKIRKILLPAGAVVGGVLALWLRINSLPESPTLLGKAVLVGSALVGGVAVGYGIVWVLFKAFVWLVRLRQPWSLFAGVSTTVVLSVGVIVLCTYMVQLSSSAGYAHQGQAPLALKVLALRFGPPIEGWNDIIPVPAVLFLLVVFGSHFVMTKTRFGRYVYAIGGNERAALYSGINVDSVKLRVYAIAGVLSALAGVIHCAQLQQGNPNDGMAYELDAIAAVVVGGTLLSGGNGSVIGTLFGVLIIGVIDNIMGLHVDKIDSNWQLIVKGAIIIVTVLLQRKRG